MSTKLHIVSNADTCTFSNFLMMACQAGDYSVVAALPDEMSKVPWLLGNHVYEADWFRAPWKLEHRTLHLGSKSWLDPVRYDERHYRHHGHIELMFGRLKNQHRVAVHYN